MPMLAFYAQNPWQLWFLPAHLVASFGPPLFIGSMMSLFLFLAFRLLPYGFCACVAWGAISSVYNDLAEDKGSAVALLAALAVAVLPPTYLIWAVKRGGEVGRPRREQRSELNRYDRGFDGRDGRIDKARRVMR